MRGSEHQSVGSSADIDAAPLGDVSMAIDPWSGDAPWRRFAATPPTAEESPALPAAELKEQLFTLLLDNMIEGCQLIDAEFRYVYLNPAALVHARREATELLGKKMSQAYPGIESTETYAVLSRCMRERVACRFENEFVFPSGARGVFDLHIVPAPAGLFIFSIDLTEFRRLAAQMRQSQKVIAIGQLAAGAAHDLNNLLTVVTGSSEMLLEQIPPYDPKHELTTVIRDAADRGAEMVTQILAFQRHSTLQSKLIDLNLAILEARPLLQRLAGNATRLELHLDEIKGAVNLHPTQLQQILMNLTVNAREAMPQGGVLTITTAEYWSESGEKQPLGPAAPRFVKITVRDTGAGMSEEVLARIFEPFFTTKQREGKSSGLGLTTVYELVRQAGGSVAVESAPGKGAAFNITLPIFD